MRTREPSPAAWAVRVASWVLLASVLLSSSIASVSAQTSAEPRQGDARALFRQGEASYRLGNYEDAVDAWNRAFALDARPRIQFNLSQAFERLGRLQDAVTALETYVQATPPEDPLYGEASARLSALRQRIASTGILVRGGAPGAQILVDGQAWGVTPRPDRIPVAPGSHSLVIVGPNGRRHEIAVAVQAGQVVDVDLPAGLDEFPRSEAGDSGTGVPRDGRRRGHALLAVGVGVAGVGAAMLGYGIARQVSLSGCSDPGYGCLEESTVSTQRSVGFGLGAGLLAAGGALIVVDLVRAGRTTTSDVRLGVGLASLSLEVRR